MPDVLERISVAHPSWWLRAVAASLMISVAMTMERRADMVFFFSVLSFVSLVAMPSEDAFGGLVDHISENPGAAVGGAVALLALLFVVAFIVGLITGPNTNGVTNEHLIDTQLTTSKTQGQRLRTYGYIMTAIAIFAAALLDTIPRGVSNVLMGLLTLPMITAATGLGGKVRAKQEYLVRHLAGDDLARGAALRHPSGPAAVPVGRR
jgi:hypothetical protein